MKYYEEFVKLGCFSFDEAVALLGNDNAALQLLRDYVKKKYIAKVRKGLYVALSMVDGEPVANKFVIASKLSNSAAVSHHSAFEYYGYANQVSYEVSVSSKSRFNPFDFNGISYERTAPSISQGVNHNADGVTVTDIERTVLDSINDFENNMGFEELIQCITSIPILNEDKMLHYLEEYNKCFLYQKTGFIFSMLQNEFGISDSFLKTCKMKSGNSSRYLVKGTRGGQTDFNNYWHLTMPKNYWQNITGGGDINAII